MKRIFSILLVITLFATVLSGCAPDPQLTSHNVIIARAIVNAVDDYLDGNISARAAHTRIDEVSDDIDRDSGEIHREQTAALRMSTSALRIRMELSALDFDGSGDVDTILENRNAIARLAGLDNRRSV